MDKTVGFGPADRGSIPRRLVETTVCSQSFVVSSSELAVSDENEATKIEDLSKHQIENLIKRLSKIKKKKYLRNKDTKYGNLNKRFTEGELRHFFNCYKSPM